MKNEMFEPCIISLPESVVACHFGEIVQLAWIPLPDSWAFFKIKLYNKGWKQIKILSSEAIPTTAIIDDKPLALTLYDDSSPSFYGFMTNATGTVNVEISFFVPASSSEFKHTSKFSLNTVPVCLSTLEIEVDENDCDAWVDPGFLLKPQKNIQKRNQSQQNSGLWQQRLERIYR